MIKFLSLEGLSYFKTKLMAAVNSAITTAVEAAKTILEGKITEVESSIQEVQTSVEGSANKIKLDGSSKQIQLLHGEEVLDSADVSDLYVDGILDKVEFDESGDNLVFTWNAEASKSPVSIPVSKFFNKADYYTKNDVDGKFTEFEGSLDEKIADAIGIEDTDAIVTDDNIEEKLSEALVAITNEEIDLLFS